MPSPYRFVLKSGAGFSLFHWIATAASDFLANGGRAGTFFFDATYESFFFVGVLGAVVFFVAFVQMLFYLGTMAWIISKFAWFFFRTMNIVSLASDVRFWFYWLTLLAQSGAEAVIASSSPFIGQGESALLVKPYVNLFTPSEVGRLPLPLNRLA